jgi:hypothetical protein
MKDGQQLTLIAVSKSFPFGLRRTERFIGLYEDFAEKSHWGDATRLGQVLDLVWAVLLGAKPSPAEPHAAISDVRRP